MSSNILRLDAKYQRGRRIGLTRGGNGYRPLHTRIDDPPREQVAPDTMPAKTTVASKTRQEDAKKKPLKKGEKVQEVRKEVQEADIFAPPQEDLESDSDSEDDRRSQSANITHTTFSTTKDAAKPQILKGKRKIAAETGSNGIARPRSTRGTATKANPGSPKRKSQEEVPPSSSIKEDIFGNLIAGAKKKKVVHSYGSSQSRLASSQSAKPKGTQDDQKSPRKAYLAYPDVETPEKAKSPLGKFSMPKGDSLDSPDSSPVGPKSANKKTTTKFSDLKDGVFDSEDEAEPEFKSLKFDVSFDSPPPKKREQPAESQIAKYVLQATQAQDFQAYDLDDSGLLLTQAQEMLKQHEDLEDELGPIWKTQMEESHPILTQAPSVCPMCHRPVDPELLEARGRMNTRAQEQFCQSHQRKDAQTDWEDRAYPEINWVELPKRLSKFRKNIDKWINGADSHFRKEYGAKLDAGQDRSLRKATSNLTPGYYGSRGLQAISEYIMQNNTRLLKKVAPKDRLISKRSVTAYVQSVLVPEITTLLIMEDMSVDEVRAREILEESRTIGELLQEEIKDVHVSRGEDTDREDDDERETGVVDVSRIADSEDDEDELA